MILFEILFCFQLALAQSQNSVLDLSPDAFYVHYDQNYNVWRRIKNALKDNPSQDLNFLNENGLGDVWLSALDKTPKKVFLIELFEQASEISAEDVDPAVLIRLTGPTQKRLIPVFEEDFSKYRRMGRVVAETTAYKLLGRSSWYLAPTPEGYGGVFFKKIQNIPLYQDKADRALFMIDYLESGLSLLPEDLQNIFIAEQLRVSVATGPLAKDIFVFRSAEVLHNLDETTRIFPLHGLLGTSLSGEVRNLKSLAKLNGLTEKEWKQKFLYPELARITAYLHLVLGVSLENHTQNVLAKVDMQTGELKGLFLRDLGDGIMNPIVRLARGDNLDLLSQTLSKAKFKNMAYHSWIEPTKVELAEVGYNTAVYTGQSLDSHGRTFRDRLDANVEFIKHYLFFAEKIVDSRINLSEESNHVLESLKNAIQTKDVIVPQTNSKRGRIDSAVAFIIEEIYQKSLSALLSKKIKLSFQDEPQSSKSRRSFLKAITENRVAYVNQNARNQIVPWLQKTWIGEKISNLIPGGYFFGRLQSDILLVEHLGSVWALNKSGELLAVEFIKSIKSKPNSDLLSRDKHSKVDHNSSSTCTNYLNRLN